MKALVLKPGKAIFWIFFVEFPVMLIRPDLIYYRTRSQHSTFFCASLFSGERKGEGGTLFRVAMASSVST